MKGKQKRELIEWIVLLTVVGGLFLTGWHTPVIGTLQRGLLATGIIRPDLEMKPEQASYDLRLISVEGQEISLQDWRSKTIFMNYWATWCAPCIAEMPDINDLYKKMGDDVQFAMISVDKDRQKAIDFVRRKEFDFPVYFVQSAVPSAYASASIPTTFVISPEGQIVMKNAGMAQYSGKEFINFLNAL